jgi:hypothetical protein
VRNGIIIIFHDRKCNRMESVNIANAIEVFYFVT